MPRRVRLHKNSEPRLNPPDGTFARKLHRYIQRLGCRTIEDAAKILGFSRHSVLLWRRGDREPGVTTRKLLEAYMKGTLKPPGKRRR